MFAKDKVSQSMIDAVNSVINEGKVDESSEKVPTSTGMKVYGSSYGNSAKAHRDQTKHSVDDVKEPTKKDIEKDSKLYQKGYHGTSKHYLRKDTQDYFAKTGKNEEVKEAAKPDFLDMDKDGNKKESMKKAVADKKTVGEELKGNQHKIDANHNNKIDGQDFKILKAKKKVSEESEKEEGHEDAKQDKAMIKKMVKKDEGDCVTKPEAKTIAKKEVGGHEKRMHKENVFYRFAKQLQEDKSKGTEPTFTDNNMGEETPKKNQDIADKAYLKHKPGTLKGQLTQVSRFLRGKPEIKEDAEQIDETPGAQAMKASGVKQSPDKLLARTGMNMAHKFPRKGQTNLGNIPAMNTPGNSPETDAYAEKRRGDRAKELKPAIKATLGTHGPKSKLPEEVDESVQTQATKTGDKITTDMLTGRMPGGKLNSFKNYKVDLTTSGVEAVPKEFDNGVDTKEKQKITTSPGPIDIKTDDKLGNPKPQKYFSSDKKTTSEEVEAVEEKVIAGMSGFKKIKGADEKGNVTDKSGAVHTPMSRAKSAAKLSFAKLKQEMLGKISN